MAVDKEENPVPCRWELIWAPREITAQWENEKECKCGREKRAANAADDEFDDFRQPVEPVQIFMHMEFYFPF